MPDGIYELTDSEKKEALKWGMFTALSGLFFLTTSAIPENSEFSLENDPLNLKLSSNAEDYQDAFFWPLGAGKSLYGKYSMSTGGNIEYTPVLDEEAAKKYHDDVKTIQNTLEIYLNEQRDKGEIGTKAYDFFNAQMIDRIKMGLEGNNEFYISSRNPLGLVLKTVDACLDGNISKEYNDKIEKWDEEFPLWSFYIETEKSYRTIAQYWDEKDKNGGQISEAGEELYRAKLYQNIVQMEKHFEKIVNGVADEDINQKLRDDKIFASGNNPFHIHPLSNRGMKEAVVSIDAHKKGLENGWPIDDLPLLSAFGTITLVGIDSKISNGSMNLADFKLYEEKDYKYKSAEEKDFFSRMESFYSNMTNTTLKSAKQRKEYIKKMNQLVDEGQEKGYIAKDSSQAEYFKQVLKDVQKRTRRIDSGKEKAFFKTGIETSLDPIGRIDSMLTSLNKRRAFNQETEEHKDLRLSVEDYKKTLADLNKDWEKNKEPSQEEFFGKIAEAVEKLDKISFASDKYVAAKKSVNYGVGMDRLRGAKELSSYAAAEKKKLFDQYKAYFKAGNEVTMATLRGYTALKNMNESVMKLEQMEKMPTKKGDKKELVSLAADIMVGKYAVSKNPAFKNALNQKSLQNIKKEIMKDPDFQDIIKGYLADKSVTPAKIANELTTGKSIEKLKRIEQAYNNKLAEKQIAYDNSKKQMQERKAAQMKK